MHSAAAADITASQRCGPHSSKLQTGQSLRHIDDPTKRRNYFRSRKLLPFPLDVVRAVPEVGVGAVHDGMVHRDTCYPRANNVRAARSHLDLAVVRDN